MVASRSSQCESPAPLGAAPNRRHRKSRTARDHEHRHEGFGVGDKGAASSAAAARSSRRRARGTSACSAAHKAAMACPRARPGASGATADGERSIQSRSSRAAPRAAQYSTRQVGIRNATSAAWDVRRDQDRAARMSACDSARTFRTAGAPNCRPACRTGRGRGDSVRIARRPSAAASNFLGRRPGQ